MNQLILFSHQYFETLSSSIQDKILHYNRFMVNYISNIVRMGYISNLNPDKPKFRSNNIYQLYPYLNNLKEENKEIEGMLLYPNTTSTIRNERIVSGKRIMINNINLNQEWEKIEEEMLDLVK